MLIQSDPGLNLNCLQIFSADVTARQRLNGGQKYKYPMYMGECFQNFS